MSLSALSPLREPLDSSELDPLFQTLPRKVIPGVESWLLLLDWLQTTLTALKSFSFQGTRERGGGKQSPGEGGG